ncbi:hypothetical protein RB594_009480 [Gaeumannomyces avenae]
MNNTGSPPNGAPPPGPPLKFQPGERENYNRGPEIIGVSCTFAAMAFVVVCLRVWVRIRIIRQMAVEDYLMVLAVVMLVALVAIHFPMVQKGAGRHMEYIPPADLPDALHINFASQPMSLITLGIVKLSVGTFLLRVSPSRFYTRFIWTLLGVTVALTVAGTLQIMLHCRPLEFVWNKALPGGGQCTSGDAIVTGAYIGFVAGIATDFIFAVLPIPMLWNVQLNRRVKVAIMGILSLGLFTTAAGIIKTMFIANLGKAGDFMWDSVDIAIWYNAEIGVAIIAGSIPSLKPLFKKILASTSARRYAYGGNSKSRGGGTANACSKAIKASRAPTAAAAQSSKMPPPRASKHMSTFAPYGGGGDIDNDDMASDKLGSSVFEVTPSPGTRFKSHAVTFPPPVAAPTGTGLRRSVSTAGVLDGDAHSATAIGMATGASDYDDGARSGRSSGESSGIIMQRPGDDDDSLRPGRITRTLEVSVAVEDAYQRRSVKDMV